MIAHDRVRVSEGAYPVEGEELSTTMSFAGRTAVISGGGRGLGRTYALEMAHRGASIVINDPRSEEHTSELQSLMRISYAVFCLKKKTKLHKTKTRIK